MLQSQNVFLYDGNGMFLLLEACTLTVAFLFQVPSGNGFRGAGCPQGKYG